MTQQYSDPWKYWSKKGIDLNSINRKQLKRAYHRSLQEVHPDKYRHLALEQQFFEEKTRELIHMYEEAIQIIENRLLSSPYWKIYILTEEQVCLKQAHLTRCKELLISKHYIDIIDTTERLSEPLRHDLEIRQILAEAYLKYANAYIRRLGGLVLAREAICKGLWNYPSETLLRRCFDIFNYEGKIRARDEFLKRLREEYADTTLDEMVACLKLEYTQPSNESMDRAMSESANETIKLQNIFYDADAERSKLPLYIISSVILVAGMVVTGVVLIKASQEAETISKSRASHFIIYEHS